MSYLKLLNDRGYSSFLGRRRFLLCIRYKNEYISIFDNILDIYYNNICLEYGVIYKGLVVIKKNNAMIHKNDIILPFPKNEKQAELLFDVIISILKEQPFELFRVDNRRKYKPKEQSYINKKLEELNIWNYYYYWKGSQKTSGTFVKNAWSFKSDTDVYECMSKHDISKMKRRAGRKYIEHEKWEYNYSKRIDIKRHKRNIIENKKLK